MKSSFNPRKRKDGLWEVRYWARYEDGTKERKSLYGHDKTKLKERYLHAVAEAINSSSKRDSSVKLNEYLPNWVTNLKEVKGSTMRGYECIINNHILPFIGDKKVSEVDLYTVQKLIDDVINKGSSLRTAQFIKWIMSKSMRRARKLGLTSQIIDPKDIELAQHIPAERPIWSREDAERFVEAIKGDKYELFYKLYITYGLRRGEAIALKWEDIDFDNKLIHINKQFAKEWREFEITSLKTKSSIRDLPLTPSIEEILINLRGTSATSTGFIVSDDDGKTPIAPEKVSRHFETLIRRHNLPKVVLHSLRHFVATGLKDADVPLKDTAVILGHSSINTTLKYYQHSDLNNKREAIVKYANSMGF